MRTAEFEAWVTRARETDILSAAQARGAVLKRQGREWVGPCCVCGGVDRLAILPAKQIFNCRGAVGGDVITYIAHTMGFNFVQSCEELTGQPPPGRHSAPLSDEQRAHLHKQHEDAKQARKDAEAEQAQDEAARRDIAKRIWERSKPIAATHAETYLLARGLIKPPGGWPVTLRYVEYLRFDSEHSFPALIGRADDVNGKGQAIQRIFLDPHQPKKAPVPRPKVTLASNKRCAVRLGGVAHTIAVCEGIETGLAVAALNNFSMPVWACLGTAGLVSLHLPPQVKKVCIWPDGDAGIRKKGDTYVPSEPAGMKAAAELRDRLVAAGIYVVMNPAPQPAGSDYLDALKSMRELELS